MDLERMQIQLHGIAAISDESTSNDGCPSCEDAGARCERGWCGCLTYIPVDGRVSDPGDGNSEASSLCNMTEDCQVFACEQRFPICGQDKQCTCSHPTCNDGQDPVCSGISCTCPPLLGPSCDDSWKDCSKFGCDNDADLYAACIDHHCLCAKGISMLIQYHFAGFSENVLFDLVYTGHPELKMHENHTYSQTYHI